jgi:hypothetical protein
MIKRASIIVARTLRPHASARCFGGHSSLDLPLLLMLLLVLLVVGKPAHVAAALPSLKIKARHQVIINLLLLLEVYLPLGVHLGNSRALMSRPCRRVTLVNMRKLAADKITCSCI